MHLTSSLDNPKFCEFSSVADQRFICTTAKADLCAHGLRLELIPPDRIGKLCNKFHSRLVLWKSMHDTAEQKIVEKIARIVGSVQI